jgi:hypothetical protein
MRLPQEERRCPREEIRYLMRPSAVIRMSIGNVGAAQRIPAIYDVDILI